MPSPVSWELCTWLRSYADEQQKLCRFLFPCTVSLWFFFSDLADSSFKIRHCLELVLLADWLENLYAH